METITAKTPWAAHMGGVPMHLDYFEGSMFDKVADIAAKYPNNIAFDFMGKSTTYKKMVQEIERCARALKTIGVREGDKVTIAMPNCPQAIYMFYAVNRVGAIANMIHPLSAEKEIEFYLNESESVTAITLDQFYHKFERIRANTKVVNIIIASVADALSKPIKAGYMLTEGRKIKKIPKDAPVIRWKQFMRLADACFYQYAVERKSDDPAVILYSGGTTGTTKGIVLSNKNFNALGQQVVATNPMFRPGDKMLAAMPLFHGFGLGVCIHTMLSQGGRCILIPRFTAESYAKQITKYRCNFIAGVPTLYEALLRLKTMDGADLSCLKGVFSGGDSLSVELKKKFDKFLYDHKATIQVREGYGTTETVTACCLTPVNYFKEGSIGIPFPDTYIKIVEPGTDKELPYGEEGEILLAGPTVMKEYMKHPDETAQTLRRHADGLTWVYTGDLGTMDEEGFIYFKGRAKRMIISSGLQCLSRTAREHPRRARGGADELRHRRARHLQDAEGQGVRQARRRVSADGGDPADAPGLLPQAHRQVRHAVRHRLQGGHAQDPRRQGGLPRAGGRGAQKDRGRGQADRDRLNETDSALPSTLLQNKKTAL